MPDWKKIVRENLPMGRFRGEMGAEIQEEIAAHLEDAYQEQLARGATEEEAAARALAEVDDWGELAERILASRRRSAPSRAEEQMEASEASLTRRGSLGALAADVLQELRFSLRRLRRAPLFTAVVLLSLGVGIGADTAIYSVVKGVLLDPLPYSHADRLVAVWNTAPGADEPLLPQSFALNAVYEDDARSFENVGIWGPTIAMVAGTDGPREMNAIAVTQGLFPALDVEPALGRGFTFEDTQTGPPTGQTSCDHFDLINPKVRLYGDMATVTFDFASYTTADTSQLRTRWRSTQVLKKTGDDWEIVHIHWTLLENNL